MLRIYSVALDVVRDVGIAVRAIEQHDADLARQAKRAAASVPLNLAEGSGSTRGTRRVRYESARGSAYEVRACLEVAERLGYTPPLETEVLERIKHVIGALHLISR